MGQTQMIKITPTGTAEESQVTFDPPTLTAAVGDLIYWQNDDEFSGHWPAPIVNGVIQPLNWMDAAIPVKLAGEPAPTSQQAVSFSGVTTGITYGCAVAGHTETGTIIIQ